MKVAFAFSFQDVEDAPRLVVIGLGNPNPNHASKSVILNHKGFRAGRFTSVSQFVHSAPNQLWANWRRRVASTSNVDGLIVEDYSLDTCFAWLLFCARLERRPVSTVEGFDEGAWVDYVTAWEEGRFVDASIDTSPACLFTALSHALLPPSDADAKPGFERCLEFLQDIVDSCPEPPVDGLPRNCSPELQRQAAAQVTFDRQQYTAALHRGQRFQLLIPSDLAGPGAQRLLFVDALAMDEVDATGILKVAARNDRENTWTKGGFGLLALYRPSQVHTGDDMTVSVDPAKGLTLKALWQRLEEMEDERWGKDRPRDKPRELESYRNADGSMKPGAPNQPWYDEGGKFTLIGAPKENGTRLDWYKDVLPTVWDLYFLQGVRRRLKFVPQAKSSAKNVHVASWQPATAADGDEADTLQLLPETPSFRAWLGACSQREREGDVSSPTQLPKADAFEVVPHANGYSVVTREGVSIFFWSAPSDRNLVTVAETLANAVGAYSTFLNEYSGQLNTWVGQLEDVPGARQGKEWDLGEWARTLASARTKILETDTAVTTLPTGYDEDGLRTSLTKLWGLHEQRDEMRGLIDRLDELMRQRIARRTERRQLIYGSLLSAAALAFTFGDVFESVGGMLQMAPTQVQLIQPFAQLIGFGFGLVAFWLLGIRGGSSAT
jgi:hypothetical protein